MRWCLLPLLVAVPHRVTCFGPATVPGQSNTAQDDITYSIYGWGYEGPRCYYRNTLGKSSVPLFRAVDHTNASHVTAGQPATLRFALQYFDNGDGGSLEWKPASWDRLVMTHGAKVHLNIMSASGRDFYHVHAQRGDGEVLAVPMQFRRPGRHLVAITWVIEVNAIGLCTDEYVPHAHGVDSSNGLFPLLEHTYTLDVGAPAVFPRAPDAMVPLAADRSNVCMKRGFAIAAAGERMGLMAYDDSYALDQSATCCECDTVRAAARAVTAAETSHRSINATAAIFDAPPSARPLGQCTANSTCAAGGGCLSLSARAWPLDDDMARSWSSSAEAGVFPVGACLAVEIRASDGATGDPITDLGPCMQPTLAMWWHRASRLAPRNAPRTAKAASHRESRLAPRKLPRTAKAASHREAHCISLRPRPGPP